MTNLTSQSPKGSTGKINPFNRGFVKSSYRGIVGTNYGQQPNDGWNTIRTGSYTIGNDKSQTQDEMWNLRKLNPSGVRVGNEERNTGFSTSRQDCDNQGKVLNRVGKIHIRKKSDRFTGQEPNTAPPVLEREDNSESFDIVKMITGELAGPTENLKTIESHQKLDLVESNSFEDPKKYLGFQEPNSEQLKFFKSNVNLHQIHEIGEQANNNDLMSERRQEFSATFNNQLSSVKKEVSSSGNNKSTSKFNFYPSSFPEQNNHEGEFEPF